jgi:S-adenosylmethionine/arginine decarboxylase-like enzyme
MGKNLRKNLSKMLGKHYLLNLYGCSFVLLNDEHLSYRLTRKCSSSKSGATVIQTISKKFDPQGVTVHLFVI